MIHISGRSMMEFAVDDLSRGDTSEGIVQGIRLISFIPIHLSEDVRSKFLIP